MATLHNTQQQPFTAYPNHKETNMADTKIIVNCETGEVSEVELTAEEIKQREADAIAYAKAKADEEQAAAEKAAAKAAIADRLGLTQDELALLLA